MLICFIYLFFQKGKKKGKNHNHQRCFDGILINLINIHMDFSPFLLTYLPVILLTAWSIQPYKSLSRCFSCHSSSPPKVCYQSASHNTTQTAKEAIARWMRWDKDKTKLLCLNVVKMKLDCLPPWTLVVCSP